MSMKIVYVYSTMAKAGGTERMIAEKASFLSEHYGYDVTIISCIQREDDENSFYTSKKVKQINLGIPFFHQYKYRYPRRLWYKWRYNRLMKKGVGNAVKQENPDILIGVSRFMADFVSKIKCRAKKVIECHETRYNTRFDASIKQSGLVRFFAAIYGYLYFRTIERHADVVVTLTEGDEILWKKAKRTVVIPNFSTTSISQYTNCTSKRVIAVGRLAWEKGFERLIKIWSIVSSKHPDWNLDIFGEGQMRDTLMDMVKHYQISNLTIHNCTSNISLEYANSSICTSTSFFEGFSLVILEAMTHGVPCVSFDCPFGPRSIIDDEVNGFLVKEGDINLFAERLCLLIENEDLRKQFSNRAIEKAKAFDVEIIMDKCRRLYEEMLN